MAISTYHWLGFLAFLIIILFIDLGIFNKKEHEITIKEAIIWTFIWITLALIFNVGIFFFLGHEKGIEFFTGYLLEKSLSVDNIFVFVLLFKYFSVPKKYQHKVLYWGIIGALIMRAILITLGATLITYFHWIIFIFGGFLIVAGLKMAFQKEGRIEPEKNPIVKLIKKYLPVTDKYEKEKFFIRRETGLLATPLLIVLVIIETTDFIFAFDSIPAILAITRDIFIVFTSNAFAILGLRALYFALAGFIDKFKYLKTGLSVVLVFVGMKMLISDVVHISTLLSLMIIVTCLLISLIISLLKK